VMRCSWVTTSAAAAAITVQPVHCCASGHQPVLRCCAAPSARRLKDIIYGFGTNNVYVVLECMDCDLRHLLDADRQLDMREIKVSTPSLLFHGARHTLPSIAVVHGSGSKGQPPAFVYAWHLDALLATSAAAARCQPGPTVLLARGGGAAALGL
jgi:hypothetical protein